MNGKQPLAYCLLACRSLIYGSTFLFVSNLLRTTAVMDVLALRFLISATAFLLLVATRAVPVSFRGKPLRFLIATFPPVMSVLFETIFLKEKTTLTGVLVFNSINVVRHLASGTIEH